MTDEHRLMRPQWGMLALAEAPQNVSAACERAGISKPFGRPVRLAAPGSDPYYQRLLQLEQKTAVRGKGLTESQKGVGKIYMQCRHLLLAGLCQAVAVHVFTTESFLSMTAA